MPRPARVSVMPRGRRQESKIARSSSAAVASGCACSRRAASQGATRQARRRFEEAEAISGWETIRSTNADGALTTK